MNSELRDNLLAMMTEDLRVRQELIDEGVLFNGYHPTMEAVHQRNAAAMGRIIDSLGWPGISMVGEEAARAACMIVQHSISNPPFMRRCLLLLRAAVEAGDALPQWAAYLEDAIAFHECRPQTYGLVWSWNEKGEMAPGQICDPEHVNEQRAQLGLPSIEADAETYRTLVKKEGARCPKDPVQFEVERRAWARSVGWIQ